MWSGYLPSAFVCCLHALTTPPPPTLVFSDCAVKHPDSIEDQHFPIFHHLKAFQSFSFFLQNCFPTLYSVSFVVVHSIGLSISLCSHFSPLHTFQLSFVSLLSWKCYNWFPQPNNWNRLWINPDLSIDPWGSIVFLVSQPEKDSFVFYLFLGSQVVLVHCPQFHVFQICSASSHVRWNWKNLLKMQMHHIDGLVFRYICKEFQWICQTGFHKYTLS